jgi:hypothetical protein
MPRRTRSSSLLASLRGRFSAPLATLTTVALLATIAPVRVARASAESIEPADTPNFSESTNGVKAAVDSAASTAKATKARKAPVSAKGSFTRSVDIQVPPGRLGMTPSLGLHYDSSSVAESAVGVGWSFGPPMISRSTRLGFPKVVGPDTARSYDDAGAIFTGPSGEMVPATDGPAGATGALYAPARETSPVRYEYLPATDGGTFVEHDPSGKKRYFGKDPCLGRTARITSELGTSSWLLLREEDPHGNSISYRYHNDTEATRANKRVAQRTPVLARVEWGSNGCVSIANAPFVVSTTIEAQAGPLNLLEGNTLLDHRVRTIDVSVEGTVKWTYTLGYTLSAETGKSLLTSVQRTGDAPETISFGYSAGAPASGPRFAPMGALSGPVPMYTNSSRWQQSLNPFEPARTSPEQAVQAAGFRPGTKFIDVDGNGTTDAIYHAAGIGTLATHVLWEESALQAPSSTGLGAWSTPPRTGATQANTGLAFFPLNDALFSGRWTDPGFGSSVVQDLVDLDGDGDADTVSLPLGLRVAPGPGVGLIPPPPYVETRPAGQKLVRITTNIARNAGAEHPVEQLVPNWPAGADLISVVRAASAGTGWTSPLKYKAEVESDLQLPLVDLNADGRSDMVLLKHRNSLRRFLQPGGAIAVPHSALLRMYSGAAEQELGELDERPLEEEIRGLVRDEGLIVLVDEDLLLSATDPGMHVRLPTASGSWSFLPARR